MLADLANATEEPAQTQAIWKAVNELRKVKGSCHRNFFEVEDDEDDADECYGLREEIASSRRTGAGGSAYRSSADACRWGSGTAILEVDKLIKGGRTTLTEMIKKSCPELNVQEPDDIGKRRYARVKVLLSEEQEVRRCIKGIAKEMGKRTCIKTVSMLFDQTPPNSPRE